jgi:adenine/guanine phosphoribosyltransferase-like PRPP-binding protein
MNHTPRYDHVSHLKVLRNDEWLENVEKCVAGLKPISEQFDAIAVRGLSGLLLVSAVAAKLDKTVIVVRKRQEVQNRDCHSHNFCEGDRGARTYIILDDFIDTGATAQAIAEEIREWAPQAKPVGVFRYYWTHWLDNSNHDLGLSPESCTVRTDWFPQWAR